MVRAGHPLRDGTEGELVRWENKVSESERSCRCAGRIEGDQGGTTETVAAASQSAIRGRQFSDQSRSTSRRRSAPYSESLLTTP